jgi:arylsulfatase A-like enzyme
MVDPDRKSVPTSPKGGPRYPFCSPIRQQVWRSSRRRHPVKHKLGAQGLRLTQFYAGSTVCAPTRSVLMTGLHMGHVP